jgi:hypothetical protein
MLTLGTLIIGGSILSLCLTIWYKGNFKTKFFLSSKYAYPLSGILFLFGYIFHILRAVIINI